MKCCPVANFAKCVMTLYLLKLKLQTFLSIPITQKCQIFSLDTHVKRWICYICVLRLILRPAITLWIQSLNQWEMKLNELNYHQHHLLKCPKLHPVYRTHNTMQQYRICRRQFCLIIVFHSIPSMALQPHLGHGLPQNAPPYCIKGWDYYRNRVTEYFSR